MFPRLSHHSTRPQLSTLDIAVCELVRFAPSLPTHPSHQIIALSCAAAVGSCARSLFGNVAQVSLSLAHLRTHAWTFRTLNTPSLCSACSVSSRPRPTTPPSTAASSSASLTFARLFHPLLCRQHIAPNPMFPLIRLPTLGATTQFVSPQPHSWVTNAVPASIMTPTPTTMTLHLPVPPHFERGVSPTLIVKTVIHLCIYPSLCKEIQRIDLERKRHNEFRGSYCCGSGSHSRNLLSAPCLVCYIPIRVSSAAC